MLQLLCLLSFISQIFSRSNRYDRNFNVFSPDGQIIQVKYANQAALKGHPLLCIQIGHQLLIASPSSEMDHLLDRRISNKLNKIDDTIWICFAGLRGDGLAILKEARNFVLSYKNAFGSSPSVAGVASFIGDFQHACTLKGSERPLGVQIIVFGYNSFSTISTAASTPSPSVYYIQVSGEIVEVHGISIGANADKVNLELEQIISTTSPSNITTTAANIFTMIQKIFKSSLASTTSQSGVDFSVFSPDSRDSKVHRVDVFNVTDMNMFIGTVIGK